jgi:hypothetical protein
MDAGTLLKVCFKCKQEKPLDEFYRHSQMGDGHLNKCNECTKKDVAEHRDKNIDAIREYDRSRARLPHRVLKHNEVFKKYCIEHPEKVKAVDAANNAMRSGVIKKLPCVVCGTTERLEKHHSDYSKPLEVVFLCSVHHKAVHYGKMSIVAP